MVRLCFWFQGSRFHTFCKVLLYNTWLLFSCWHSHILGNAKYRYLFFRASAGEQVSGLSAEAEAVLVRQTVALIVAFFCSFWGNHNAPWRINMRLFARSMSESLSCCTSPQRKPLPYSKLMTANCRTSQQEEKSCFTWSCVITFGSLNSLRG